MKIQMKKIRPYLLSIMIHYLYIFSWLRICSVRIIHQQTFPLVSLWNFFFFLWSDPFFCGTINFWFCGTIHFLVLGIDPFTSFLEQSILQFNFPPASLIWSFSMCSSVLNFFLPCSFFSSAISNPTGFSFARA
jgi:hypothetical protein